MLTGIIYVGDSAKGSNNWTEAKDMFSIIFKEDGLVDILSNCGNVSKEDSLEADPLKSLMLDINGDISNVAFGTPDLKSVLDSEYCFS